MENGKFIVNNSSKFVIALHADPKEDTKKYREKLEEFTRYVSKFYPEDLPAEEEKLRQLMDPKVNKFLEEHGFLKMGIFDKTKLKLFIRKMAKSTNNEHNH